MTQSDLLTTCSLWAGKPVKINGREVSVTGPVTTVSLHGKPCIRYDAKARTIELDGATLPTRKSCRLFNAILTEKTSFRAFTREGKWFIEDLKGVRTAFSDQLVTVPMN